jgi:hypothetical protein
MRHGTVAFMNSRERVCFTDGATVPSYRGASDSGIMLRPNGSGKHKRSVMLVA